MVYNISATGISLVLLYPVTAGTALVIEPWDRRRARGIRARVVRSTLSPFAWFLGCEFAQPLSDAEICAWLT
jgi:hypothetical protein